jgi:bifunctional NMN adenylyltransferase/nudix hydrolase
VSGGGKRELGVVIARFQTYALTDAHQYLLSQVATRVGRVLILLGSAPVIGTRRNPLEVGIRMRMVQDWWAERYPSGPEMLVLPMLDSPSDAEWASRIDATISAININGPATIYCGPDGAGGAYSAAGGRWPVEVLDSMGGHASKMRYNVLPRYTEDFRAGIIYATERRFLGPLSVVDVVVKRGDEVLLAHKNIDGDKMRLIGGFVDVGDDSLEMAAQREVREETGIEVSEPMYAGSAHVPDWRYRDGPEVILSSVFVAQYVFGAPRAADDIDGVEWVPVGEVYNRLHPIHRDLYNLTLRVQ